MLVMKKLNSMANKDNRTIYNVEVELEPIQISVIANSYEELIEKIHKDVELRLSSLTTEQKIKEMNIEEKRERNER